MLPLFQFLFFSLLLIKIIEWNEIRKVFSESAPPEYIADVHILVLRSIPLCSISLPLFVVCAKDTPTERDRDRERE